MHFPNNEFEIPGFFSVIIEMIMINSDDLDRWDGSVGGRLRRERDRCLHITDSLCCAAESNTAF